MNQPKLWILVLVSLAFLSGGVSGFLLAVGGTSGRPDHLMGTYEEQLTRAFDLDETQRQDLRFLLGQFERELYDLEARHLRGQVEDDLIELGTRTHEGIRRWVIPADRTDEFDALSAGITVLSSAPAQAAH